MKKMLACDYDRTFYLDDIDIEKNKKAVHKFIEKSNTAYETEIVPFVDAVGNCQLARMPGDARIYEQKPEGVTEALIDFLLYLNGNLDSVGDYYDDSLVIDWETYAQQKVQEGHTLTAPEDVENKED